MNLVIWVIFGDSAESGDSGESGGSGDSGGWSPSGHQFVTKWSQVGTKWSSPSKNIIYTDINTQHLYILA